ncbi:hypothetical protein A3G67_01595 [Candidatus Roizmanbacteria bacterium RIFCSPLOWO2_12_FULL_40_12]|uniref:Steroid 5-alpha reductase C-terminal domain-containing protein n=1 Tax=Candidatus Roizmanbacteria bacterium RIFCSPLOWO2_01_FULL_40_42 TaxID=1802066 RepID=A0A1F7J307_9BACT|nr:MAG: hypothetical protein A2779_03725 [Candidatus Roizmanbacteria bacterium RIFCSPHIGHO2_01_FULL_40_98]OGK28444.1 MAG: hypothetical protein A3C31_02530 [Candidatus Roizmanbacteria bacterium RIFCSPHIGHO2_02_FULL_40_53]OGK30357.1 MAG: hypothetical protein A2W49_01210 [Candidatus Roizmanbacteria bacterium RIFCSPHIGHO2_12_41_18]OGK36238.1 MAG: hypothetical protein A3E69_04430 [Candidatus Roizmanbacteria bacterium RIFCSPHIGHO2_12_FULL_40_130]OGK49993.1 MAG: hypothetical protein A3B50_03105 [Candi
MLDEVRVAAIVLLVIWQFIWIVTEQLDKKKKPRTKKITLPSRLYRGSITLVGLLGVLQMFDVVSIWTFRQTQQTNLIGLTLLLIGFLISLSARISLGANWAHGAEYQIVKEQELITKGIYSVIRHPIYTGLFFAIIGIEILAHSYLVIPTGILFFLGIYSLGKKEEKLLAKHFGSKYKEYMKKTKMFIPYLF